MTLSVTDLSVRLKDLSPVDAISFKLAPGTTLGIVGESGSGKTLSALSLIGLLPPIASADGAAVFDGADLMALSERGWCDVRGSRIAMVFQNAQSALNPLMRIGAQLRESMDPKQRRDQAGVDAYLFDLLAAVRLRDPRRVLRAYPHELSGGERQRVLIAIALAGRPQLVLADEPTAALDSITRIQILRLLRDLSRDRGHSLVLITHDLSVVASLCDQVAVMYGGRLVEHGPTGLVLQAPRHRYTAALLEAIPTLEPRLKGQRARRLPTIPGVVPPLGGFPSGCVFRDRCRFADETCTQVPQSRTLDGRIVACWHPVEPSG
jgi:peptide/nickel transport system ATP-binding protein